MFEQPVRRLAVATLSEVGDAAALFRGPGGRPLQGYVLVTGEGADCRITVYLNQGEGNHTAVLAGDMVWFQAQSQPQARPAEAPLPVASAAAGAGEPWAGLQPDSEPPPEEALPAEPGFKLYAEPATPVSAIVPHKIEVVVTPLEEAPSEAPAAEPAAEPAIVPPAEPAAEAEPVSITLSSRHPLAPRAGGTARLDRSQSSLTLTVRGLPSPAVMGRPYNAYRAWLLNQRAGTRQPLGLLTRVWGENFKLESEGGLPLSRFDAVLITAEDRLAGAPIASAPQVLVGDYDL
ncbi:MAG TPA: hypothetical protein VD969_24965 [Symbiobacteriaceae bacterium]|nr:hypothetical protein [Symbiobacteriaceae bacterium]